MWLNVSTRDTQGIGLWFIDQGAMLVHVLEPQPYTDAQWP